MSVRPTEQEARPFWNSPLAAPIQENKEQELKAKGVESKVEKVVVKVLSRSKKPVNESKIIAGRSIFDPSKTTAFRPFSFAAWGEPLKEVEEKDTK